MTNEPSRDVTVLLASLSDTEAAERLLPIVYDELHRLASSQLARERVGHTLQPTALVNEAYLKLVDQTRVAWQGREHFFAVAATAMRRILVDHARGRAAAKRGGQWKKVTLASSVALTDSNSALDLVALDEALSALEEHDQRMLRVVELRFFAGLTVEQTARVLGISERTVKGDWRLARALLRRALSSHEGGAS
jgi:RNA polymerase sigma factor (TIGR02999 family)